MNIYYVTELKSLVFPLSRPQRLNFIWFYECFPSNGTCRFGRHMLERTSLLPSLNKSQWLGCVAINSDLTQVCVFTSTCGRPYIHYVCTCVCINPYPAPFHSFSGWGQHWCFAWPELSAVKVHARSGTDTATLRHMRRSTTFESCCAAETKESGSRKYLIQPNTGCIWSITNPGGVKLTHGLIPPSQRNLNSRVSLCQMRPLPHGHCFLSQKQKFQSRFADQATG